MYSILFQLFLLFIYLVLIFDFRFYNEDAHIYQQYGSIDTKPNYDKNLLTKRAARFSSQGSPNKKSRQFLKLDYHAQKSCSIDDDEFHIDTCHIVGTCIDLEKKYLRLTAVSYIYYTSYFKYINTYN